MDVVAGDPQGERQMKHGLKQSTAHDMDALTERVKGRDHVGGTRYYLGDIALGDPIDGGVVGLDEVEAARIDLFDRQRAVHGGGRQRFHGCDAARADGQFVDPLDARQCAVAIEADDVEGMGR